jgi:transposase InsO family protein
MTSRAGFEEGVQAAILERISEGKLSVNEACKRLGIDRTTLWRKRKRYEAQGAEGLAHGLRGRESNFRHPNSVRQAVLALFRDEYWQHGFRTAHFFEDACSRFPTKVGYSTVVKWLRAEGLVEQRHRGRKHRTRRPRKEAFGEMLQMDTSIHDWFGLGEKFALISTMDDATGRLCGATLTEKDTTLGNMGVLMQAFNRYGLPQSLYVDRSPIFRVTRTGYGRVLKHIMKAPYITQVQRALEELGVELIFAYTPQAKGRIERSFGTWQSRLVPELKKAGIVELGKANAYVHERYIPRFNEKFAKSPRGLPNAFVPVTKKTLEFILAEHHVLTISNDHVVSSSVANIRLRILPSAHRRSYAKAKVDVFRHVDGRISVRYKDELLRHEPLAA